MASYLTRRACSSLSRCLLTRSTVPTLTRSIHISPIVHKKKAKFVVEDDQFSDLFSEEDLIKETEVEKKTETVETIPAVNEQEAVQTTSKRHKKGKLSPEARKARFESRLQHLDQRTGRTPKVENPRVRKRSLVTLVQLARSEEDLKTVTELIPKYKAAGFQFSSNFAEALARRCDELKCPHVALKVFGDYAKNNLHLTLGAGQWLVHSLSTQHPKQLVIALALFNVYRLPPISEDLPTASLVAAAYCERASSTDLKDIAKELRNPIAEMLKSANISKVPNPEVGKKSNWIISSLVKANKASLSKGGEPFVDPSLIPSNITVEARVPTPQP